MTEGEVSQKKTHPYINPCFGTLLQGDALTLLRSLPTHSVDAVVTDPPAGISFLNKEWDTHTRHEFIAFLSSVFTEALRVVKPGAHAFVWALPRTSHWTASALENSGWEIRDVVTHVFGSGFPKSLDVSKAIDATHGAEREVVGTRRVDDKRNGHGREYGAGMCAAERKELEYIDHHTTLPATPDAQRYNGYGTALKPASEHWILARAPLSEKNIATNVLTHGCGALNIDASRVGTTEIVTRGKRNGSGTTLQWMKYTSPLYRGNIHQGRFPANFLLSHSLWCNGTCIEDCPVRLLDGQSVESNGASRYFPCFHYFSKSSRSERNRGIPTPIEGALFSEFSEGIPIDDSEDRNFMGTVEWINDPRSPNGGYPATFSPPQQNDHPTVKSIALMKWLVTLVTPPEGVVLDMFCGSGSTLVACQHLGYPFIGIEQDEKYCAIARARLGGGVR